MWKDWQAVCESNNITKATFYWRMKNHGLTPDVAATKPLSGPRGSHKMSAYSDRVRSSRRSFQPFQEDEAALLAYSQKRNLPLSDAVAEIIHLYLAQDED